MSLYSVPSIHTERGSRSSFILGSCFGARRAQSQPATEEELPSSIWAETRGPERRRGKHRFSRHIEYPLAHRAEVEIGRERRCCVHQENRGAHHSPPSKRPPRPLAQRPGLSAPTPSCRNRELFSVNPVKSRSPKEARHLTSPTRQPRKASRIERFLKKRSVLDGFIHRF